MHLKIIIVDYGMGNIRSVTNAFSRLDCDVINSKKFEDIEKADAIVLPGVGAFGEAVNNLKKFGLFDLLKRLVNNQNIPFLGICLGMQLMASNSEERGLNNGLGIIPGTVKKISTLDDHRIPHVGWNSLKIIKDKSLMKEIPDSSAFYFVHSYEFICEEKEHIIATTDHGKDIVAVIKKGSAYGVQFHPERSQSIGLKLIKNFVDEVARFKKGS